MKEYKVPRIKELKISEVIKFAKKYFDVESYLPEIKDENYPCKKWVCNVSKYLV
jgi:hypothetical protein